MGDFPHYFDIILFAMVAAFLVLRLRSGLGRRTGNERRRTGEVRQGEPTGAKVIGLCQRGHRGAHPCFAPRQSMEGARAPFEMIVAAFAEGDKAKLRPLLSDEVYQPFSAAIDDRIAAHETLESRILALKQLDIVAAELAG